MYTSMTHSIVVTVDPMYLEEESVPDKGRYVWAYSVRIENRGAETVRLTHRHWRITDGLGRTQEVQGKGVVGEQPVLAPGETFEYTSGAPLPTPSGFMVGCYTMATGDGRALQVDIPAFSLDVPDARRRLH